MSSTTSSSSKSLTVAQTRAAIATVDAEKLARIDWEAEAVRAQALTVAEFASSNVESTTSHAVQVHSIVTFGLHSQSLLDTAEQKAAYAERIQRSATRLGDFRLYGRALIVHQWTGEDFTLLTRAASGGHRKEIAAVIKGETIEDRDAFRALLVEAIRVEKVKADERTEARKQAAAEKKAATEAAQAEGVTTLDAMAQAAQAVAVLEAAETLTDAERNVWANLAQRISDSLAGLAASEEQAA